MHLFYRNARPEDAEHILSNLQETMYRPRSEVSPDELSHFISCLPSHRETLRYATRVIASAQPMMMYERIHGDLRISNVVFSTGRPLYTGLADPLCNMRVAAYDRGMLLLDLKSQHRISARPAWVDEVDMAFMIILEELKIA